MTGSFKTLTVSEHFNLHRFPKVSRTGNDIPLPDEKVNLLHLKEIASNPQKETSAKLTSGLNREVGQGKELFPPFRKLHDDLLRFLIIQIADWSPDVRSAGSRIHPFKRNRLKLTVANTELFEGSKHQ